MWNWQTLIVFLKTDKTFASKDQNRYHTFRGIPQQSRMNVNLFTHYCRLNKHIGLAEDSNSDRIGYLKSGNWLQSSESGISADPIHFQSPGDLFQYKNGLPQKRRNHKLSLNIERILKSIFPSNCKTNCGFSCFKAEHYPNFLTNINKYRLLVRKLQAEIRSNYVVGNVNDLYFPCIVL